MVQLDGKAEVQAGAVDVLRFWPKYDGAPAMLDSGSGFVTILDPSGGVKVARAACTVDTQNSVLSVSRTWNEVIDEDYIAVWEWTVNAVVFSERDMFDIVKVKLPCMIDTTDLEDFYPDIRQHLNAIAEVDASRFARRAWSMLLDRIRSSGHRPSLVIDRARLVNVGLQCMAALTCNALSRSPGDIWDLRAAGHAKSYEALFSGLGQLKYDRDEDGVSDDVPARVNRIRAWV